MAEEVKKRRLQAANEPTKAEKKADKPKASHSAVGKVFHVIFYPFRIFKFLKFLVPSYFKNAFKELRLVTWPSRKETMKLTFAVFMFAIIFGAFITALDYILNNIFKRILLR